MVYPPWPFSSQASNLDQINAPHDTPGSPEATFNRQLSSASAYFRRALSPLSYRSDHGSDFLSQHSNSANVLLGSHDISYTILYSVTLERRSREDHRRNTAPWDNFVRYYFAERILDEYDWAIRDRISDSTELLLVDDNDAMQTAIQRTTVNEWRPINVPVHLFHLSHMESYRMGYTNNGSQDSFHTIDPIDTTNDQPEPLDDTLERLPLPLNGVMCPDEPTLHPGAADTDAAQDVDQTGFNHTVCDSGALDGLLGESWVEEDTEETPEDADKQPSLNNDGDPQDEDQPRSIPGSQPEDPVTECPEEPVTIDEPWNALVHFAEPPMGKSIGRFLSHVNPIFAYLGPYWWIFYQTRWPPFMAPGHIITLTTEAPRSKYNSASPDSCFNLIGDMYYISERLKIQEALVLIDPLALSPWSPIYNLIIRIPSTAMPSATPFVGHIWRSVAWISVSDLLGITSILPRFSLFQRCVASTISLMFLTSNWVAYFSRLELGAMTVGSSRPRLNWIIGSVGSTCLSVASLGCGQTPLLDAWPLWLLTHLTRALGTLVFHATGSHMFPYTDLPKARLVIPFNELHFG